MLETVKHRGIIHDCTGNCVKKINTVFVRAVDHIGDIHEVQFEMVQVPRLLTGEILCDQIVKQISCVKKDECIFLDYILSDSLLSIKHNQVELLLFCPIYWGKKNNFSRTDIGELQLLNSFLYRN